MIFVQRTIRGLDKIHKEINLSRSKNYLYSQTLSGCGFGGEENLESLGVFFFLPGCFFFVESESAWCAKWECSAGSDKWVAEEPIGANRRA